MKSPRWPLVALALLFFGPFLVAVLLYAGRGAFGGFERLPNPDRELIAEPGLVPLEPLRLADGSVSEADWSRSRWSLIYARISPCEGECEPALIRLHQVWLRLGGDRDRARQIFLAPASELPITTPAEFLSGQIDAPESAGLIAALGEERLEEGRYFVVDPLGNVILSYPDAADQERLLHDLERLLEYSRVG